mmetsp:Transcript_5834/g.12276  ORF Transcript_5834/g.12276 Transcript_5834/m.12276 type:complete len:148 (+) Transcript_5834:151-594(+)
MYTSLCLDRPLWVRFLGFSEKGRTQHSTKAQDLQCFLEALESELQLPPLVSEQNGVRSEHLLDHGKVEAEPLHEQHEDVNVGHHGSVSNPLQGFPGNLTEGDEDYRAEAAVQEVSLERKEKKEGKKRKTSKSSKSKKKIKSEKTSVV